MQGRLGNTRIDDTSSDAPPEPMKAAMRSPRVSLIVLALGAALTGCGGSDTSSTTTATAPPAASSEQRGILDTVDALQAASRKGDSRTICRTLFTRSLVRSIEKAAKGSCARAVRKSFSPGESISVSRDVQVTGDRGSAMIREQNGNVSTLYFVKQADRWQIDRVQPQSGG